MKKVARSIATIASAAVILSFAAACGTGASPDANEKSGTLTLWTSATGADAENAKKTIDNYNATKPAFKVKFVTMKQDTMNAKLATVGRSGKGAPDLAQIASENVPIYQSQDVLETWDSAIKGTKLQESAYVPAAWQAGRVKDKQYGIPATMGSWVMYYNKDLVDKYIPGAMDDGIATFDEIMKAGAAARADGVYSYANPWTFQNYDNIYLQLGGKWLDSNGKISVNNQTSHKAFSDLKELNDKKYMVPNGVDAMKTFLNGKLIFLPEGTWSLNNVKTAKFQWGETMVPQWDLNNLVQCSGVDQYVILHSQNQRSKARMKGMVDFMEWLQSNQMEMLKSGANPSALAMLDNPEYTKMPQSFLLKDEKVQKALNIITTNGLSYVNSEVDARGWDMITGKAKIADTFKEIQQIAVQKTGE